MENTNNTLETDITRLKEILDQAVQYNNESGVFIMALVLTRDEDNEGIVGSLIRGDLNSLLSGMLSDDRLIQHVNNFRTVLALAQSDFLTLSEYLDKPEKMIEDYLKAENSEGENEVKNFLQRTSSIFREIVNSGPDSKSNTLTVEP